MIGEVTEKQQQSELGCSDTIPYSIYTMKKDHLQTHSVKQVWPSSFGELWKHAVPTAGHISKSNSEHRSQIHLSNCSSSQGLDETTLLQHIALLELELKHKLCLCQRSRKVCGSNYMWTHSSLCLFCLHSVLFILYWSQPVLDKIVC